VKFIAGILALAATTFAGATGTGQDVGWLDARATGFSGVVLVGRGDAIETVRAYGMADRERRIANTADTRFNLGSINKTFTAIAIAQLIQQGRVSLDDTLAKHLPDYPNAAAGRITVRDLISHRSGIPTFMRADFGTVTVADMVKIIAAEPLVFSPGERQEYSNGGYVVLGRLVEVIAGQPYEQYIATHVYRPAAMTKSGFLDAATRSDDVALGYFAADAEGNPVRASEGATLTARTPARGNPAGGGYSTAADLFRFARALRTGRLLDARMTDYVLNGTFSGASGPKFGFALREQIVAGRRFIGNGGGAPGVNAEFRFDPAGDVTVVVLSNASPPSATQLLGDILNRVAGPTPSSEPPSGSRARP
jgi:CubicO group peptidase (beta-lactamase class C family)